MSEGMRVPHTLTLQGPQFSGESSLSLRICLREDYYFLFFFQKQHKTSNNFTVGLAFTCGRATFKVSEGHVSLVCKKD